MADAEKARQESAAVVQVGQNHGLDQELGGVGGEKRMCMSRSSLQCSRRGTVCCPSPLWVSMHRALPSPGFPLGKLRNQEGKRLEQQRI